MTDSFVCTESRVWRYGRIIAAALRQEVRVVLNSLSSIGISKGTFSRTGTVPPTCQLSTIDVRITL